MAYSKNAIDEAEMLSTGRAQTNILNFKTIYFSGFLVCVSLLIYCEWEVNGKSINCNAIPLYFIMARNHGQSVVLIVGAETVPTRARDIRATSNLL
jgi:hypothetical protein